MKKIAFIIIIIIFVLIVIKVFRLYSLGLKRIYPDTYFEYVDEFSRKYEIEKEWIFSLIKAESNFDNNIVSKSGAIGLMQVMESTGEEVARQIGIEEVDLYNAKINIEIGTKYFTNLIKYYNGNYNLAIAAYNAGIGNVAKWIDEEIIKADGSDVENIPFKETNNYVRKIINNYKMYKELYGDEEKWK